MSRDQLRRNFIVEQGWGDAEVEPLVPDASFRRYFRLKQQHSTLMLMDAPPAKENVNAFVTLTRHLESIGVRVANIHGQDMGAGFLLLEDLGDQTFNRLLADGHDEFSLYRLAIAVLSAVNQHADAVKINLPRYDPALALAESNLLVDWYLPARQRCTPDATVRDSFAKAWGQVFSVLPTINPTLVLRDFHLDNLMMKDNECALLDYQDAVIGSPAYDLVSLLQDARRDIPQSLINDMLQQFQRQNPDIDPGALSQHYAVWGAQRHCKVAGIFVRLWLRDGKDIYLQHLPRVMGLLDHNLRHPMLEPVRHWLGEHLGDINHQPFEAPASRLAGYCPPA